MLPEWKRDWHCKDTARTHSQIDVESNLDKVIKLHSQTDCESVIAYMNGVGVLIIDTFIQFYKHISNSFPKQYLVVFPQLFLLFTRICTEIRIANSNMENSWGFGGSNSGMGRVWAFKETQWLLCDITSCDGTSGSKVTNFFRSHEVISSHLNSSFKFIFPTLYLFPSLFPHLISLIGFCIHIFFMPQ